MVTARRPSTRWTRAYPRVDSTVATASSGTWSPAGRVMVNWVRFREAVTVSPGQPDVDLVVLGPELYLGRVPAVERGP